MNMQHYDYLIVGAGLFGAVFAYKAREIGKKCLVIDRRPHIGGNLYCENIEGIHVHKYGAHIFHTSNKEVWDFVNSIVEFNRYTNSPVANYKGKLYNLPFNMNTFYQMWSVTTPAEAQTKIESQKAEAMARMKADGVTEPRNLEEQAQLLIGKDIYEKLIKGYTEKQWGRKCTELPAFIIKRLPVRMVFDNNYFNDKYQGIPIGGYNVLIEHLLKDVDVRTNCDFFTHRQELEAQADKVVFTGAIDELHIYEGAMSAKRVAERYNDPNVSGISSVETGRDGFVVYPALFTDEIAIQCPAEACGRCVMTIYSATDGRTVHQGIYNVDGGSVVYVRGLDGLAAGSYVLSIENGTERIVRKLLKANR